MVKKNGGQGDGPNQAVGGGNDNITRCQLVCLSVDYLIITATNITTTTTTTTTIFECKLKQGQ